MEAISLPNFIGPGWLNQILRGLAETHLPPDLYINTLSKSPVLVRLRSETFKTLFIKLIRDKVIEALVIIFNKSFLYGHFLIRLIRQTSCVHGKSDTSDNYRPISLVSMRLFGKIMYIRIPSESFIKNQILHKCQFGSKRNHATSRALIDVMQYIYTVSQKVSQFRKRTLRKYLAKKFSLDILRKL